MMISCVFFDIKNRAFPFAAAPRAPYVTALAVGEGSTGVLATALVLVQLRGRLGSGHLYFSVTLYFWFMAIIVLASLAAFVALLTAPRALAERIHNEGPSSSKSRGPMYEKLLNTESDNEDDNRETLKVGGDDGDAGNSIDERDGGKAVEDSTSRVAGQSARRQVFLLAWLSALQNGVKPAVLPYAVR